MISGWNQPEKNVKGLMTAMHIANHPVVSHRFSSTLAEFARVSLSYKA
jgi:hypothetical protein